MDRNDLEPGHCYALAMAKRLKAMGAVKYQADGDPRTSGPGFGVRIHPAALGIPARWPTPRLVFVNSMSDLFHARVPESFIRDVFAVMASTPQHTYQVLTKRAVRARRLADRLDWPVNLWMGVSVEDQHAMARVGHLLEIPAAVRFLSCEPLLGPIDLTGYLYPGECPDRCGCRRPDDADRHECACGGPCSDWAPVPAIGWVIAGGESGPAARPMRPDWVRDLRDDCAAADIPFFFKQWGGRTPKRNGRVLDGRIHDAMPTRAG
ncbi:phage Gp37/Gp68 family protein [Nocardia terpenica]|uniref:DUF5131 family protein n=1 Tax=Nocardia terpenica TaxID=455432 RepID=UPI002FE2D278